MNPVRFAILGCGRIAKNHVGPLTELPGAKLAALCDLLPQRMEEHAARHQLPVYTDYHEMLRREAVDVVSIMTPSGMHPEHAIDIIGRYRKHVVMEKPMALAWDDLARMQAAAKEAGVNIFPVYQNRYNKAVQKVKSGLDTGELGRPVVATVRLRWCRPQRYYARDAWRGTWSMDGGAATNQGIHYLDLLQYLVGDVDEISARVGTQLVQVEVEDTAVATVRFKNGALGVIEITTAARPDDFEASISVLAEKGTAILSGIACNQLSTYTPDRAAEAANSEEFPDAYGFSHWPFYRDVLAEIQTGRPHPVSFAEGCRAIRLLNALYRSAEDARVVRLEEGVTSRNLGRRDDKLAALYRTEPRAK